ncbi:hypothetical protein FOZ60_016945 [Perkinsus olseni]|uniref:Uncharacterized protein n=1 Tax=Perkinsus olseni TaxID=32597 RepID=A0A7J6P4I3_PEROL|nr:hypothetical protein FOZ60_016945 [Perkinsus olseni]KAF4752915.1 hypothetical protein FOZ62_015353 [Perkinsus olseni]
MPSSIRPRSNNLNWLYRSFCMFVCIVQVVKAQPDGPLRCVADYPPSCYDGPGLAQGGEIYEFLDFAACFYILKGVDARGVQQESPGIIFRTTASGLQGNMKIQLNTAESHSGNVPNVTVEIGGSAYLGFTYGPVHLTWNPYGDVSLGAITLGRLPDGRTVSTPRYNYRVDLNENRMRLTAEVKARDGSDDVYEARQIISLDRRTRRTVPPGWDIIVGFQAVDLRNVTPQFDGNIHYIARGYLNS